MKNFNNSDLFTGYLKQLLHTFNLPKIKVYTKQHAQYAKQWGKERPDILSTEEATPADKTGRVTTDTKNVRYFPYIKDGEIQEYVNDKWQNTSKNTIKQLSLNKYVYGDKILNYTKTLKINSNTYDSYTHEYLGDYLRFHRDFLNLNLMPLYNCFSNRACDKLKLNWTLEASSSSAIANFDTTDLNFKIYMIPVKLFQKYTIAIDSELPIEICCGLYGDYQDKRTKFAKLPQSTYKRVAKSVFSQPFLYEALAYTEDDTSVGYIDRLLDSKIADKSTLIELAQNEGDLKLFLKVPAQNTSTIVILEGDYCSWNGAIWDMSAKDDPTSADAELIEAPGKEAIRLTATKATKCIKRTNKSIINLDRRYKNIDSLPLVTPLQLLQFNTKEQHPFADRLIEYLIGNAITNSESEIYDNIRRAQKALESNYGATSYIKELPGIWSNEMRILFYEYMTHTYATASRPTHKFDINHDILGYVDKDVEKYYQATVKLSSTERGALSLAHIELNEGEK